MKRYRYTLRALVIFALLNLICTASLISLVGSVLILCMVLAMKKGEYELRNGLSILLLLHALVNVIGLIAAAAALLTHSQVSLLSTVWLLLYTIALCYLAGNLRRADVKDYLAQAPKPEKKEKTINFFHGGWRDL